MAYLDQMNVKANEQDTVGTDYDLRDKDLNAAAATTSVGSNDGIVLKGTDGSYHTIDKSSFTEAVRGVLGGILNNMTSKGTAVKGVSVIDNSNDFGLTTPSDLASVLGGLFMLHESSISSSYTTLVETLCARVLNHEGLFISNWAWTGHGGGYQAIIASQHYTNTGNSWNVAGLIFDYHDGSLHHFIGKYSDNSWSYQIDE